jgi:hypothetical protein
LRIERRVEPEGEVVPDEIRRSIINYCGPVLMGLKPAALFMLRSKNAYASLSGLLPVYLAPMILRQSENGLLVLVFEKEKLEKTLSSDPVRTVLSGMGYPIGASIFVSLDYLKKQFKSRQFPHEIGLFLGYPVDDVLGFVKHQGKNCKLCGYWKVYGNVEQAKLCFRQYDKCREYLTAAFENLPWITRVFTDCEQAPFFV